MNDITLFPADIAAMSVSQLAALPAAQKAEIDKNLDEALDWIKKARTKFDAALDAAYGEKARTALRDSGRDFGTAHLDDGPLHIKFELPKKVSWDQKKLGDIAARIVASGEKVEHFLDAIYRIPALPFIADGFNRRPSPARPVGRAAGSPGAGLLARSRPLGTP